MSHIRKVRCKNCRRPFQADPRVRWHQKYCSRPPCQKASKTEAQRLWRKSKKGRDYYLGPANALRVKEWRREHPGYWKRKSKIALQDQLPAKLPAVLHALESKISALQDQLQLQSTLVLGVIAKLAAHALQDKMDQFLDELILVGEQLQRQLDLSTRDMAMRKGATEDPNLRMAAVERR